MRKKYILLGSLCLAVCVTCLVLNWYLQRMYILTEQSIPTYTNLTKDYQKNTNNSADDNINYESPVDFTDLQSDNPDIYAWICISDTNINYPILQREDDNTYYLKRNSKGQLSKYGALFTESSYNNIDFSDTVTIIYGHTMRDGSMFGCLQEIYSDSIGFNEHKKIKIYLPERELNYEVFASVPYDNRHILYNYDFSSERVFNLFFDSILSVREIGANIDEKMSVSQSDHILTLSTCLKGNSDKRYLIFAKLVETDDVS